MLYVAERPTGSGPARAGLVVSRKVEGAFARNQAERLLREALRLEGKELPEGLDLVVVARPTWPRPPTGSAPATSVSCLDAAGLWQRTQVERSARQHAGTEQAGGVP